MTTQFGDSLRFQGERWALLATRGNAIFDPKQHGMNPVRHSTACHRGYWCEFECADNALLLRKLAISLTPVHSKAVVEPPEFAGVKALTQQEVGVLIFNEYLYADLNFTIKADLRLLIATDLIRSLDPGYGGNGLPWQFRRLMDLKIEKGCLASTEDLSRRVQEMRKRVMGGFGARREKHKATHDLCRAFDAEFPFWASKPAEQAT